MILAYYILAYRDKDGFVQPYIENNENASPILYSKKDDAETQLCYVLDYLEKIINPPDVVVTKGIFPKKKITFPGKRHSPDVVKTSLNYKNTLHVKKVVLTI
ncbi:homing endonuclease [Morganella phage vB_Mm5]